MKVSDKQPRTSKYTLSFRFLASYRHGTTAGIPMHDGRGRVLVEFKVDGQLVHEDQTTGKRYIPYTDIEIEIWELVSQNYMVVARHGAGNRRGQEISTYIDVAGNALLLSEEFRAASMGKYVHVNGTVYKNGFRGNQHLSKYVVRASKINTASTARFVGKISNRLVIAGAGFTVYDGISNGWENHHTADLVITGGLYVLAASIPIAGWIAGGVYLAADLAIQYYTGKSITENLFD